MWAKDTTLEAVFLGHGQTFQEGGIPSWVGYGPKLSYTHAEISRICPGLHLAQSMEHIGWMFNAVLEEGLENGDSTGLYWLFIPESIKHLK